MTTLETAAQIGIITRADANHVLWFFTREEGYTPGSGYESVLTTMGKVDPDTRRLVFRPTPLLAAFEIAERVGLDPLREIANAKHRATLAEIADDHAAMGRAS